METKNEGQGINNTQRRQTPQGIISMASAIGKLNKSDSVSLNKNQEEEKKFESQNKKLTPQQFNRNSFTHQSQNSSRLHKLNEHSQVIDNQNRPMMVKANSLFNEHSVKMVDPLKLLNQEISKTQSQIQNEKELQNQRVTFGVQDYRQEGNHFINIKTLQNVKAANQQIYQGNQNSQRQSHSFHLPQNKQQIDFFNPLDNKQDLSFSINQNNNFKSNENQKSYTQRQSFSPNFQDINHSQNFQSNSNNIDDNNLIKENNQKIFTPWSHLDQQKEIQMDIQILQNPKPSPLQQDFTSNKFINQNCKLSYQENIFTQLLSDPSGENIYCIDCGWKMGEQKSDFRNAETEDFFDEDIEEYNDDSQIFEQIYVSINHGIFLCHNCARIHQVHYGVEVSFIKSIIDHHFFQNNEVEISPSQPLTATSPKLSLNQKDLKQSEQKQKKLSQWTYTQLRVLIISGGNKAFKEYMDQFDLMSETIQKRYSTVAAQYYRDHLKTKIYQGNKSSQTQKGMLVQMPDYNKGRERYNQVMRITKQILPYSNIQQSKLLENLLKKNSNQDLNQMYQVYITDLETKNIENVDHLKQLCKHEKEIIQNTKNPKNFEEFTEYKESVINEIDSTLPPFFIPKINQTQERLSLNGFTSGIFNQNNSESYEDKIIEPFSELEDYLDRDDFTNLLNVVSQFAGETGSGILSFGESVFKSFVLKTKKENDQEQQIDTEVEGADDLEDDDYVVPGQKNSILAEQKLIQQNNQSQQNVSSIPSNISKTFQTYSQHSLTNLISAAPKASKPEPQVDYRQYLKEHASQATSKLTNLGKSVFGGFGLFGNKDSSGSSSIGHGVVEPESD